MKTIALFVAVIATLSAPPDFDSALLLLTGASCTEELDENTVEHFRDLERHPVDLNTAGRSRLLATGLMSPFQVASLIDWRSRSGDILSYEELALIDGFSGEYAEALRLFTRLESKQAPGTVQSTKLHHDLVLRASARRKDDDAFAAGTKYKASLGERAEFNWSSRTTYDSPIPGIGTLSAAYYGRRRLGKLVLGHFNARFGQGLGIWSGFAMSPYSGVSSMRRTGTGFAPTGSFSPGYLGATADFEFGRWRAGAAFSVKDLNPMGFVSYTGRRFTAGISAAKEVLSADFRFGLTNMTIFGEAAWNGGLSAALGALWIPSYGNKAAVLARWVDGRPEIGAGASSGAFEGLAAYCKQSFRSYLKYSPTFTAGPLELRPSLRLSARRKEAWRFDGRGELHAGIGGWALNSRLDVVRGEKLAWLLNAEAGHDSDPVKAWVRWTLFCVDSWADRIYVYERDAPGSFSVPAYYGRGWSLSLYGSWKIDRRHTVYLRVSALQYPWMSIDKQSKYEVKLQYRLSL